MTQVAAAAKAKPGLEDQVLWWESETAAYEGKLVASREAGQRSIELADRQGSRDTADTRQITAALQEIEAGNTAVGMREALAVQAAKLGKDNRALLALALARAGDTQRSAALAEAIKADNPSNTVIQYYWLSAIRAAIALDKNDPEEALRRLQAAEPYDLGAPPPYVAPAFPIYLRGLTYMRLGRGIEAAAEFQKLLQHSGVVQNFLLGSLAELQLARAQVLLGDKSAAAKSYQNFLSTWAEADHDIPMLVSARVEYSALNPSH
jgi:tetratricopeptide (TPR) repeat protein